LVAGESYNKEDHPNRYEESTIFTRFQSLLRAETEHGFDSEEAKRAAFPGEHGLEIWGLGYVTSDHSEDDDGEDGEGEDSAYCEELKRKILSQPESAEGVEFEVEEFETIANDTRLREIYSYRWWQDASPDTYFVMINKSGRPVRAGE
jgi:hypothetical protein